MADEDVSVSFGASIEALTSGVDAVKSKIGEIADPVQGLIANFKQLGEAIITGFGIEKVAEFIKSIAEIGAKVEHMSQELGMSTEGVTAFQFAVGAMGGSAEGAAFSLIRFERNLAQARDGTGPAAAALKSLGISATTSSGKLKQIDDILPEIADKFKDSANGADKTAIAMALLGRTGAQLIPFLNLGRAGLAEFKKAAEDAGVILDARMTRAMERSSIEAFKFTQSLQGLKLALYPSLQQAFDLTTTTLTGWIQALKNAITENTAVKKTVDTVVASCEFLADIVVIVIDCFAYLANMISGMLTPIEALKLEWQSLGAAMTFDFTKAADLSKQASDLMATNWAKATIDMKKNADDVAARLKHMWDIGTGGSPYDNPLSHVPPPKPPEHEKDLKYDPKAGAKKDLGPSAGEMAMDEQVLQDKLTMIVTQGGLARNLADIAATKAHLASQVALGKMSKEEETAQLQVFLAQEYDMQVKALKQEMALETTSVEQKEKINQEIQTLTAKHTNELIKINDEAALESQKVWKSMFDGMKGAFDTMISGILSGTQSFRNIMANLLQNVLMIFVKMCEEMAAKWVWKEAVELMATMTANSSKAASDTAAATNATMMAALSGKAMVTGDAAKAAAGVYANVAQIPYVGWIMAPIAAAGAFAAVEVFGDIIPSAAGGMIVDTDQLAQVHKNEMVLPANLSQGLAGMINNNSSGGGSGGVNFNVTATDARSVVNLLKNNGQVLGNIISNQYRNQNAGLISAINMGV